MTDKSLAEMFGSYSSLEAWIRTEVMPIDMQSDEAFNVSIDRFVTTLGNSVELLGLGEALHGGEEILQFRNRLFQRLVEKHGYCAIAIESSFPRSRAVNEFATGRKSGSYEALQDSGFSHGFGRLTANRELVEWMRQYNVNLAYPNKVHSYGFDGPTDAPSTDSPRQLLYFVLDYLASVDSVAAAIYRDQIDPVLGEDMLWENPEIAMNPSLAIGLSANATALRIATENLISDLNERRPEFVAAQGMDRFLEAMHDASEARQLLNYHAILAKASSDRQGRLLSLRAAMMADNLSYIASRERSRGKVLVFAHNTHLQSSKVEWQFGNEQVHWWPVGAHLDVLFGSRYAVIASAVGASPENGIAKPEASTLEALLTDTETPGTLLPTHRARGIPSEALNAMPSRSSSVKNGSYSALTPQHIKDFDWLLTFDSVMGGQTTGKAWYQ